MSVLSEQEELRVANAVDDALRGSRSVLDTLPDKLGPLAIDRWRSRVQAGELPANAEAFAGSSGLPLGPTREERTRG